ncbi:MAG: DUF4369 domain-containing protein [Bacteroidales bacterium]|nr:DUF4369 domain-containing protein [Bacteroidales bacterium]
MKKIITIVAAALLFVSCNNTNTFTISGALDGGAGHTLWLEEMTPDGTIFIDSIPMDSKGRFKFKHKMAYHTLYNLHTTDNNYVVLLPDIGEKLTIGGNWENLSVSYNVSGSPESVLLWQLQQYTNDGGMVLNDLVDTTMYYQRMLAEGKVDEATVDAKKEMTDSIYRETFTEQQDYVCRFIEENSGSLSTLIALYKPFNNRLLIDTRDPLSIEWYDLVLEGLQETLPDNPHTINFKNTTEHLRSSLARQ